MTSFCLPLRPSWMCGLCGQPWPCPTRRAALLAEYRGDQVQLIWFLSACMRERRSMAEQELGLPLLILTGWTASGKTTLVDHFAQTGLQRVTASALLVRQLGAADTTKAERLLSWLSPVPPSSRDGAADRLTDLAVLRTAATRASGCVVESAGSVSLLLSPYNDALLVRLTAAAQVRAKRLTRILNGQVTRADAARIIQRKDAATARAGRQAWGLDLTDPLHDRRYDLIIGCPDDEDCADPELCRIATVQLVDAAYRVYLALLTADQSAATEAARRLATAADRFQPWVRRLRSAVLNPGSRRRWADRMARDISDFDLPRMGASC